MSESKKRATGIGGIFFKCDHPEAIRNWYSRHLGLNTDQYGTSFEWRHADEPSKKGHSVVYGVLSKQIPIISPPLPKIS